MAGHSKQGRRRLEDVKGLNPSSSQNPQEAVFSLSFVVSLLAEKGGEGEGNWIRAWRKQTTTQGMHWSALERPWNGARPETDCL